MLKTYLKSFFLLSLLAAFTSLVIAFNYFVAAPKMGGHVLPDDYESRSGGAKQNYLWQQVTAKPYDVNHLPRIKLPPIQDVLGMFSKTFLEKTFSHSSDIMPSDRMKAVHWLGTIAKAEFISTGNHPYTGLLQGSKMMMRASLAVPFMGFTPGIGMKWFVDGKASVNLVAMFSFDGQGESRNFFEKILSHRVPEPASWLVRKLAFAFKKVSRNPFQLEPHFLAQVDAQGNLVEDMKSPYQLNFVPSSEIQGRFDSKSKTDIRKLFFYNLKVGDAIYDVYAMADKGANPILIGKIVLTSEFIASQFGDEEFFIQHHREESEAI